MPLRLIRSIATKPLRGNIKRLVFISQSNNIFTNLALEDWLYRNYDFTCNNILMLWYNDPCVVIGRHQNPWLEANISNLLHITEGGVQLARRNSGGGTVYHDRGNLNATFFTHRDSYDRKYNLELLTRAIYNRYNVKVDISPRQDLCINIKKISGTAAKLGRTSAYHHCTLLVDVNKRNLREALHINNLQIKTNATQSVKSPIKNLSEVNSTITVEGLLCAIGSEYLQSQDGFQIVHPTEEQFFGITDIREQLINWDWCYGKTPKFSVVKEFVDDGKIIVNVEHGLISDILVYSRLEGEKVITNLQGQRFSEDLISTLKWPCNLSYDIDTIKQKISST